MSATVVRGTAGATLPAPQVAVVIVVDTARIAAQGSSGRTSDGVFMMDNMIRNGSSSEGTLALHTRCNAGSLIGFQTLPVDGAGSFGNQVIITNFADIEGNVFTGAGHPVQQPPLGNLPPGSYWIGQAMAAGTETYMIEIKVTVGQLQPVRYYVWWYATLVAA